MFLPAQLWSRDMQPWLVRRSSQELNTLNGSFYNYFKAQNKESFVLGNIKLHINRHFFITYSYINLHIFSNKPFIHKT